MATARADTARRARLLKSGIASTSDEFDWLIDQTPKRVNILSEGDSWFAFPGRKANIMDWVAASIRDSKKANLLRLASSGDEASNIISGKQKHNLAEILKTTHNKVNLLLFSAGGNDVAGKWDMERLLKPYQAGFTAADCLRSERVKRKMRRIALAYAELIELRDEYSPGTAIVCHTYDYLKPSSKSAKFLFGLIQTGPWLRPYMKAKGIPGDLQLPICEVLLENLRTCLQNLEKPNNNFHVVDTLGTLRPGHEDDWRNEIHPSSSGFKQVARKVYAEMKRLEPKLPRFAS